MNYFLLKLAFDTAVHFGGSDSAVGSQSSALTLRADTIFSALCHTALEVYGEPALEELLVSADADALRISDAMPWRGDTFYLPKPIAASTSPAELSTVERKAVKKLAWIPASKFDRYTASLHSGISLSRNLRIRSASCYPPLPEVWHCGMPSEGSGRFFPDIYFHPGSSYRQVPDPELPGFAGTAG